MHRTLKKARQLAAKGTHRWRDEFTLMEVRPDSTDPDYARLLRVDLAIIPRILPPRGPEGLLLTYPLPDQRTVESCLFLHTFPATL